MESSSKPKFILEKGKTYFFICYALVCGGKSTFFEQILSQTNTEENKSKYNIKMVSSDEIRANLSKEMQKKNPNMTFKQCFDKLGKETAREFDIQIKKAIDSTDKSKINIILVDKNYPQGIDGFLKKFCRNKYTQFFIVFIPNISKPIDISNLKFPFSLNYFIQCYLRLKNRNGHEVLNGEDEQSKLVYISFFKLFQNFDFYKNIKGNKFEDKKNKEEDESTVKKRERSRDKYYENKKNKFNFNDNVYIQKINFTDESKELDADEGTKKFFNDVVAKIKAFDMKDLKEKYEKDIDSFFKKIDEKYDGKNAFEDTREKIKEQVKDLLNNGIDEK
jgi:hypothetical protein